MQSTWHAIRGRDLVDHSHGHHILFAKIGDLLPNNQRQRRTSYALCHIMYPVSAAHTSIFWMVSNSTSYQPPRSSSSYSLAGMQRFTAMDQQ